MRTTMLDSERPESLRSRTSSAKSSGEMEQLIPERPCCGDAAVVNRPAAKINALDETLPPGFHARRPAGFLKGLR
jgi:hypothetical protein